MFIGVLSLSAVAAHVPTWRDARDLAALFPFNGEMTQFAFDSIGPIGAEVTILTRGDREGSASRTRALITTLSWGWRADCYNLFQGGTLCRVM